MATRSGHTGSPCVSISHHSAGQREQRARQKTQTHIHQYTLHQHTCTDALLENYSHWRRKHTHTHIDANDNKMICRWPCCTDLLSGNDLSGDTERSQHTPRAFKKELQRERERWRGRGHRKRERTREKMSKEKGGRRVMKEATEGRRLWIDKLIY